MPSKQEVLDSIQNVAHSAAQVKHLISGITSIEGQPKGFYPRYLKRGDVFWMACGSISTKARPAVVVKVLKDVVVAIPLSSTEDVLNLCAFKSRFYGESYFSNQITTAPIEYALKNFSGVFDAPSELNKATKEMRIFLNKVI